MFDVVRNPSHDGSTRPYGDATACWQADDTAPVSQIEGAVGALVDALDRVVDAGGRRSTSSRCLRRCRRSSSRHLVFQPRRGRTSTSGRTRPSLPTPRAVRVGDGRAVGFAGELIERKKVEPGDLVTDLVEVGEDIVSAGWIVGFVFTMVTGGNDMMTGMLGGSAELLTDRRDQRRLLRSPCTADRRGRRVVAPHLTRAEPGLHNDSRHRDPDVTIPAGEKVLLLHGSANRDERAFGDADELGVRRDIDKMLSLDTAPTTVSSAGGPSARARRPIAERFRLRGRRLRAVRPGRVCPPLRIASVHDRRPWSHG